MLSVSVLALAVLVAAPNKVPEWSKNELRSIFTRCEGANAIADMGARDSELANIAGSAYRVLRQAGEPTESYARRVLKKQVPMHPSVQPGQWLLALMKQLYEDAGERADRLARFERERRDRQFLESRAKMAKAAVAQLSQMVQTKVEGVEGFISPLPIATGEKSSLFGCAAYVRQGKITVENLDRATFVNDQPEGDAPRTAGGALRELMASQKQYNISAEMMGQVDPAYRKGKGIIRMFIPAEAPAIYLNEILRGSQEGGMHTALIMVQDPVTNKAQELSFAIKKDKRKKYEDFRCRDTLSMQQCVSYIVELKGQTKKPLLYRIE